MGEPTNSAPRIASLDQFRGYTVLGMFFVNFLGSYEVVRAIHKHHHTYLSYADTIMPQFFFAVGFAYRLTMLRGMEKQGWSATNCHAIRRNLGLILLGAVLYHLDIPYKSWEQLEALGLWGFLQSAFKRNLFQTLVHIGVTSLWVMPVIAGSARMRILLLCFSAALHVGLSAWFNYDWVNRNPTGIDGGPLGFLTWTIPLIVGSLAYDAVATRTSIEAIRRFLVWGCVLMAAGYAFSCLNRVTAPNAMEGGLGSVLNEPPFVPPTKPVNMWTMSQRSGSISYLTFAAGFALVVYAGFVWYSDIRGVQWGVLRTLGTNALAGYVISGAVEDAIHPIAPRNSPGWFVLLAWGVNFGICYLFLRFLEVRRLYLRL